MKWSRRLRGSLSVLLVVVSVLSAGCLTTEPDGDGEGDGDVGGDVSPSPTSGANGMDDGAGTESDPARGTIEVSMGDFFFDPVDLWVESGTTVRFVNGGSFIHTATAEDGSWDTGDVASEGVADITFDEVGDEPYICVYHEAQGMVGTVHIVSG